MMSDLKLQNLRAYFHFIGPYFLIIQKYFTCSSGRFVFFLSVSIWYFQTIFKSFFHFSLCFNLQLQFILLKKIKYFDFLILVINVNFMFLLNAILSNKIPFPLNLCLLFHSALHETEPDLDALLEFPEI